MHRTGSRNWGGKIIIISEKIQGGWCHGCGGHVGEREKGFIKDDMSRDENAIEAQGSDSLYAPRSSQGKHIKRNMGQVCEALWKTYWDNTCTQKL
jgi:hypothetical protein